MTTMDKKQEKRGLPQNNGTVLPVRNTSLNLYEPTVKTHIPEGTAKAIRLLIYRPKREVTQEKKNWCKGLAYGSRISGGISNIAGAVGNLLGPNGKVAAICVQVVTEGISMGTDIASLAMDCDDIPFDEIKEIMEERFNKLDKGLNRNYDLLREISKVATKTLLTVEAVRTEMHEGFELITATLTKLAIRPLVAEMNTFIKYFDEKKRLINNYSRKEYFDNIAMISNVLENLKLLKKPTGESLTIINKIIHQQLANPIDSVDVYAFMALDALYYGAQTYYSVFFFLIDQHSTIASYYYKNGDLDKYNDHFVKIVSIFEDLKTTEITSLINEVVNRLEAAKNNKLISNDQRQELLQKIQEIKRKKKEINDMDLPYISADPKILPHDPITIKKNFHIPIRDEGDDPKVLYAIQYKSGDRYSKIGAWSEPIAIRETTIPTLRIPVDQEGLTRIIFRKFLKGKPQMVGVIEDASQREFRDINRDLYNAALDNKFDRFNTLIAEGANPKVPFDQGRTAVHAAAEGGSTKIINKLMDIDSSEVNRRDSNGYTPLHVASEAGYDDFLKILIRHGADVNARTDYDKVTPLHLAVKAGYIHTVESLLNFEKIDINLGDRIGFTPLHYAISSSTQIVKVLIEHKNIDVNAKSEINMTPLHLAASNKYYQVAEELLKNDKTDVNLASDGKLTALHYAVSVEDVKTVKLLKAYRANVNAKEDNDLTPLHFALSLQKDNTAMELLNGPIDVNSKDKNNVTPLHIAVTTGKREIVKKLLKKGADVNVATKDGLTPLHIAAMRKKKAMVEILADNNSEIEARTNNGTTPLLAACQKEAFGIVKYLVDKKGADVMAKDNSGNDILKMSIKIGNLDMVKYVINKDGFTETLSSVLKSALPYGSLNVVDYLVEDRDVDASCTNHDNYCPLSEACKYNYLPVVEYLVKKVRNVALGKEPLQNALQYGHLNIVKYFIEKKEVPDDIKNELGETPLLVAAKYGWYDIVKYLVEIRHKTIEQAKDDQKRSPLHFAAASGNLKLIKYLIEDCFVDPSIIDANSDTVLHHAINGIKENNLDEKKIISNLKHLIDKEKVNVDAKNSNKETPLDRAVFYNFFNVAELLISRGAPIQLRLPKEAVSINMLEFLEMQLICNAIINEEATGDYGRQFASIRLVSDSNVNRQCIDKRGSDVYHSTALHLAISTGSTDLAYDIIERNEDLNIRDELGNTPLHLAVDKSNVDIIKKLMKYGADITIKNLKGHNPKGLAKRANQEEILKLLNLEQLKLTLWSVVQGNGITNLKQFDKLKGDLCEADKNGNTLIHLAASNGHLDILNYLIGKNCSVNSVNKDGKTPLYLATSNGHIKIIQLLLDSGADINTTHYPVEDFFHYGEDANKKTVEISNTNSLDETLFQCRGVKYDNFDVVRLFVNERSSGNRISSDGDSLQYHMLKSITEGNLESITQLVEGNGADVNYLYHGLPPLADACLTGRLEIAKYLVQKGADPGIKTVFGCTSLHWAVFGGHLKVVKYVVKKNQIGLNAVDAGGRTPLHYSAMYGKAKIVKYFIDVQGLDINLKDNKGNTVVHLATQWNNEDTLAYLIDEKKVSLQAKNNYGSTPLHIAAENGNLKIAQLLLKKGAQIEEPDNNGRTPLFIATENGYIDVITSFLANGASVDTRDKDGLGLSDIATKMGHFKAQYYISDKVDPLSESVFTPIIFRENCHLTNAGLQPILELLIKLFVRQKRSAGNQNSIEFRGTACLQNNLSLGLLILQNFFDKNYPLPKFTQITPEIARATTLEIIDDLEKVIQKSIPNADKILDKLDFYQLYLDIGANIKNETFSDIPKILLKFINSGCSDDSQVLNRIIGEISKMFPKFKSH